MSDKYIGVDVGGTKIAVAVLEDGALEHQGIKRTDATDADALIAEICALVEGIGTDGIKAIGVGVPSVVDFESGTARTSVNVPLADVPLRKVLGERLGLPVFVDNDATVAALAEACVDGEIAIENLAMLTVGTGVGGGRPQRSPRPWRHRCGSRARSHADRPRPRGRRSRPGRLPAAGLARGRRARLALDRLAEAAATAHPDSYLGRRLAGGDEITGHDAVDGAKQGDEVAVGLLAKLGRRLGIGIANDQRPRPRRGCDRGRRLDCRRAAARAGPAKRRRLCPARGRDEDRDPAFRAWPDRRRARSRPTCQTGTDATRGIEPMTETTDAGTDQEAP